MFQNTPAKPSVTQDSSAETIIGSLVRISGTLTSDGDVRINGTLEKGELVAKGTLIVGQGGTVNAGVTATRCVISGNVSGNIKASEGIEITAGGRVHGEVRCGGRLSIEPGGIFVGSSILEKGEGADAALEAELEKDLAHKS